MNETKDLDLSRPEAVAVLYNRIVAASANVCRPWNYDSTGAKVAWDACRDATISHTVASLNFPSLNSYYMTKTGQGRSTRRPTTSSGGSLAEMRVRTSAQ
ncbi:MAG: UrcA family protein [Steroidobacteraceae bacterium]